MQSQTVPGTSKETEEKRINKELANIRKNFRCPDTARKTGPLTVP